MEIIPKKKPISDRVFGFYVVGMLVMLVLSIYVIVTRNQVAAVVLTVLIVVLTILSKFYSWYISAELFESDGMLTYVVKEGSDLRLAYRVKSVEKAKFRRNKIVLYGEIYYSTETSCLGRTVKKCIILDADAGVKEFVKEFCNENCA